MKAKVGWITHSKAASVCKALNAKLPLPRTPAQVNEFGAIMRMFGLGFTSNVILDIKDTTNEGVWYDSNGIRALVFVLFFS